MPDRGDDRWDERRSGLLARLRAEQSAWHEPRVSDHALDALARVPRHRFVPRAQRADSYENVPLPIGQGQTISQPFMVAWLVDAVAARAGRRILEIGTGCGYPAAVLAAAGADVWSVEIRPRLAARARARLDELGFGGVHTRIADGAGGWPEAAPFDGIVLTAAPTQVPLPLLAQVADRGVLVAPVGPPGGTQRLTRMQRDRGDPGRWVVEDLGAVRFVPLVDGDGRSV